MEKKKIKLKKKLLKLNEIYYVGSGKDVQLAFKKLLDKLPESEPYYGIINSAIDGMELTKEFTMSASFVEKINELWRKHKKRPIVKINGSTADNLFYVDRAELDKQLHSLPPEYVDNFFISNPYLKNHIEKIRKSTGKYYLLTDAEIKLIELLLWEKYQTR